MIDLFGLGKNQEPQQEPVEPAKEAASSDAAPAEGFAPAAPRGSHKLWAFLLVLDSVFVIVFAGAVAAKIYQHWKTPASPLVAQPRLRSPKSIEKPAPAPAPVASTAPIVPEPAKTPEPPKAAEPAKDAPRPPKPSMLSDAPKHRETPKLADGSGKATPAAKPAAAPAPAPAPGGPVKALKTEFKLHAPKAKNVELVGAFIVRGGRKDMNRDGDGTWTVTLYLNPGSYRYFFSVDKKKQLDPENPHSEKGASLLSIP
jgi:hypothetical protein